MRLVIQRVLGASVVINSQREIGIGTGLAVLFGAATGDTLDDARALAEKTAYLRIFEDECGKMNLSTIELGLEVMVVPNFTLFADTKKGRRPYFAAAAEPEFANAAFAEYCAALERFGIRVARGEFKSDMQLTLTNNGPVTIIIDTEEWKNENKHA